MNGRTWLWPARLFNRHVGVALRWALLAAGVAVAANIVGIRVVGDVDGWARWLPPGVANVVLLVVKLVTLGMLAYAAFWLVLLLVFVVVAAWVAPNSAYNESEEWAIGDQADHKRTVFYDPINYDDDPDPRFRDGRWPLRHQPAMRLPIQAHEPLPQPAQRPSDAFRECGLCRRLHGGYLMAVYRVSSILVS